MPKISIKLGKPITVEHLDNSIIVDGHGTLSFSKGSVEWKPAKKSVSVRKYNWAQLAELLSNNGKISRADAVGIGPVAKKKKKAVAKKALSANEP